MTSKQPSADWRERARLARPFVLGACSSLEVRSSARILDVAEERGCGIVFRNDIAGAYWSLVKDGELERMPNGVIRSRTART
jgi:hypothetical protein